MRNYSFTISDHLGNTRVVVDEQGQVQQKNEYGEERREKTGREKKRENFVVTGTNYLDYGARMYQPELGRWNVVDPLGEEFPYTSPYAFVNNNPLRFTDPTGMSSEEVIDPAGENNPRKAGTRPAGMSEGESLSQLVKIDGKQYHKNTSNLFAEVGNKINSALGGSDDYFVEHKEYVKADDKMIHEAFDQSAGFLAGGVAGKVIGKGIGALTTKATSKVFWSGGDVAKTAAAKFAGSTGAKSLEMTAKGKIMNTISPYLSRKITEPIWINLSSNFAKGASGEVNFFTTTAGPRATSIWTTVEKPILQSNGVKIITNTIK